MIGLFLKGATRAIMIRTIKKDIAAYSDIDALEDGMENGLQIGTWVRFPTFTIQPHASVRTGGKRMPNRSRFWS